MQYLPKLKIILQSKLFYFLLILFLIIYIFITTIIIKYETNINSPILIGTIKDIEIKDNYISFLLDTNELVKCNYYTKDYDNNLLGKKVKVYGEKGNLYNNTIPNTFNYKKYLYNHHIYTTFNVSKIDILKNENIFYKLKKMIINRINKYPKITKTYLNMFILGNKDALDNNIYELYQSNGIWHLFAISGMHISLIILVLNKLFKKIKIKNIIIIIFLLYYLFLTNYPASLIRAVLFYILSLINKHFNFNLSNKKILLIVASIILLIDPFLIYDTSLLYSFTIIFSIFLFNKYIHGNYLTKILKISIISFLVSIPITVSLNYEINLLSIILNIFYVPFISFIVFPLAIITFIFPIFSNLFTIFIKILLFSNMLFNHLKIIIIIPKMSILIIIIYYLIIYLYYKMSKKILIVLLILLMILNNIKPKVDSNFYVYYLDVSQGDSIVIITPYKRKVIMIDTGGIINKTYNISDNTIKLLKSLGISKINLLISTHGDYDHLGESLNIIDKIKVDNVIFNNDNYNDLEKKLIKKLKEKNIKYTNNIDKLNIDNIYFYFLNTTIYDNENDNSNVIYFKYRKYKFLFMGDAGIKKESDILSRYNIKNIDFYKVGHHGSNTSTSKEFLDRIKAKNVIISVGRNNIYHHPSPEVLDRINTKNIFRTDLDGTIRIKINNNYNIESYPP